MKTRLSDLMNKRAFFVAGRHPWTRRRNDPVVASSIHDASTFLKRIDNSLGDPQISGGTTENPEKILTLYWGVKNINMIVGVYVSFKGHGICDVRWHGSDGSEHLRRDISIEDLDRLNVPQKFRDLSLSLKPYKIFSSREY